MEELRAGVFSYLSYLEGKRAAREQHFPEPEPEEQPHALALYWTCKAMGGMWEAGGVGDQPHLLAREFMECSRAEWEYEEQKRKLEEQLRAMHKGTTGGRAF